MVRATQLYERIDPSLVPATTADSFVRSAWAHSPSCRLGAAWAAIARRFQLNSTQIAAQLALESSSLGLCSIIVSEVEVNVMLRRWDKAQVGGEIGWRAA